jgi:hypothetical protein
VAIFEEVTLTWDGREYKIPPERVLRCIAAIEDVLPLWKLAQATVGEIKLADISQAFGAALRFAGANVSNDEVYARFFEGDGAELAAKARAYCFTLQALMIPPAHLRGKDTAGKGEAATRAGSSPSATS